jgi:mannose-6-phosphate isomerase-like protein (cupin superfamily)
LAAAANRVVDGNRFRQVRVATLPKVRWAIQPGESPLFGSERGCDHFEQRLLHFEGASDEQSNEADDEVLYVLAGSGRATIAGEPTDLLPGTGVFVARGSSWQIADADGLELLSVLVRDPLPANGSTHAIVAVDGVESGAATAGRHFHVLASPELGCRSVTQFVGIIPVVRAPDHFHKYEEVVYVLEGEGKLHIDGETAPLRVGTCVHLPAGIVHCLENVGPGMMRVLGVFRPAGSPAEAYYPDGTAAQY